MAKPTYKIAFTSLCEMFMKWKRTNHLSFRYTFKIYVYYIKIQFYVMLYLWYISTYLPLDNKEKTAN